MFWIIEQNEKPDPTLSPEFQADLDRLGKNHEMEDELVRQEINYTLDEVCTPLTTSLEGDEPLFVLAHSDYHEEKPWIAGRFFEEFSADMVTKFTPAGLSGRTLWFLVCHTGRSIVDLAEQLAAKGVVNTTIYLPTGFIYLSTLGIPHVLSNQDGVEEADRLVAKYGCEYMSLTDSKPTGGGWAGCTITGEGKITQLTTDLTEEAVVERFDPEEKEA